MEEEEKRRGEAGAPGRSNSRAKAPQSKNDPLGELHAVQFGWLYQDLMSGTSLVVQWVRLRAANAGGLGSIPGRGTRSRMPQLRSLHAATESPQAATNSLHAATKRSRMPQRTSCVPQLRPGTAEIK